LGPPDGSVPDAGGPAPDLQIASAHLGPEPGVPSEPMELVAIVENRGSRASLATGLRACDLSDPAFCVSPTGVPPLAQGARAVVRAALPAAATIGRARDGIYRFRAEVDPAGVVRESREDNNARTLAPSFIVVPVVPGPTASQEEDEHAEFVDGVLVSSSRVSFGADGSPSTPWDGPRTKPERGPEAHDTFVDPRVRAAADHAGPEGVLEVIVHYRADDDAVFPRLPDTDPDLPRFGDENARTLARRAAIFEGARRQRRSEMTPLMTRVTSGGGVIGRFFVLGWSFEARIPAALLSSLSADSRVRSIEPVASEEIPPWYTVEDARATVGTDEFFDAGSKGEGWNVGLLDTGVRETHELLTLPDRIDLFRDCVDGNDACVDIGDPAYDAGDSCNHGTSSASIISGTNNLGPEYRGVTRATIDSYRVYGDLCSASESGMLSGLDRAVFWNDQVIVAEVQFTQNHKGSIADAADDAFEAGSLVIAANGNNGPAASTVNSPANAHNALGIGAYDGSNGVALAEQSRGPTDDGRVKPDVRFPNESVTGGDDTDTNLHSFGGTSGATPYAAGTGIILLDESESMGWSTDPGRIYSMMIAFGDHQNPFNGISGAGDVFVGYDSDNWTRGTRTVSHNEVEVVDFEVDADDTCVEAAIWWSDGITWHNDIDLYVDNSNEDNKGQSAEVDSVFERVRVNGPFAATGTWHLRIVGYSVKLAASPETVYYFVRVCD
jgi:serine protease AprX